MAKKIVSTNIPATRRLRARSIDASKSLYSLSFATCWANRYYLGVKRSDSSLAKDVSASQGAFPNAMGLAGGQYVILGIVLLRHQPGPVDLLAGAPHRPEHPGRREKAFAGVLGSLLIFSIIKRVVILRTKHETKNIVISSGPRGRTTPTASSRKSLSRKCHFENNHNGLSNRGLCHHAAECFIRGKPIVSR